MSERVFAAAGIMLFAVGVALRVIPSVPVVLLASAVIGAGLPCVLIAAMTAVQRETPSELLGRVAATANSLLFAPNAIALATGAGLLALVDHRVLLLVAGTAAAITAASCLLGRRDRTHVAAPEQHIRSARKAGVEVPPEQRPRGQ
ncbi:hypothetical protein [Streptomyces agglomeratus]